MTRTARVLFLVALSTGLSAGLVACYVEPGEPAPYPHLDRPCGDDLDEEPDVCGAGIGACPAGGFCEIPCSDPTSCPTGSVCSPAYAVCQWVCQSDSDCPDDDVSACRDGMCHATPSNH